MQKKDLTIGGHRVALFAPDAGCSAIFYTVEMDEAHVAEVCGNLGRADIAVAAVLDADWFRDLTPWPAPTVYRTGPDFGGKAPELLAYFENELVPGVEALLGVPARRGVYGYSLGGLFAVYAFCASDLFTLCGCPSGSMWYDGFLEWMAENPPKADAGRVFFSIGEREPLSRILRFTVTDQRMKEACALLSQRGFDTFFCYNEGDHADHVEERTVACLRWLLGE